jgi:predicted house-cleaning NTP pyrophosphatase (Maf/HAM1 superfamily)
MQLQLLTRTCTQVGALVESTAVHFASLPPDDIAAYIDTNEPYTESGGFDLQSLGGTLVEGTVGECLSVC